MEPTSPRQWDAWHGGGTAAPERVRERIWSVPLPIEGAFMRATLCYLLLGDDGVHVIDPGWDGDDNWKRLSDAIAATGHSPADIRTVIATHLHGDHLGMAERIRELTGARIALHRTEQDALDRLAGRADTTAQDAERWGVPDADRATLGRSSAIPARRPIRADLLLDDDVLFPFPTTVRVLGTPGHTPGHLCLHLPDEDILFTGDHILPEVFPGVGRGGPVAGNALADYLTALDVLRGIDAEVLPGHGYRFRGLPQRIAAIAAHHRRRSDEVAGVLAAAPDASVWDVAARITWTAGWDNLAGTYRTSALAQTEMHMDNLR